MSASDLDFCRICFRENGNISVANYVCEDAWSLSDRIFECVSVQITPNDKLPQCICQLCLDQVIKWCEFKTVCDRNQRTWFLWLKSLSYATPQELYEGLAEKAKQKSLEIGQGRKLATPQKSAFQSVNLVRAVSPVNRKEPDDDSIVIIDDEGDVDRSDSLKELRIESTTSLVHLFGSADHSSDKLVSPNQKPTNGYIIVDSGFSAVDHRKDLEVSKETAEPCLTDTDDISNNADGEVDGAKAGSDEPVEDIDAQVESSDVPPITDVSQVRTESVSENRLNRDDVDNDAEVENAFCSDETNADDELPDREIALLNGIEVSEVTEQSGHISPNSTNFKNGNDSESSERFSVPDAPKTPDNAFSNILKNRLLEGKKDCGLPQPRRPDTPYPHEILRNMAKASDALSTIKPTPLLPATSLPNPTEERINFTPPLPSSRSPLKPLNLVKPSPRSVENLSNVDTGVSITHEVGSIRPVNILHLTNEPPTPSERMSESSDSNSYYQMDLAFRVKPEPLSEPEDYCEEDVSYSNISIKMEPVDYTHSRYNQEEPAAVMDEPLEPNQTFCKVCRKRFSSNDSLLRHIQGSATHKHILSFLATGHKLDSKMISQLSREVRSRAFFRACAKKRMRAMENGEPLDNPVSVESPAPRQNNKELLECKICNITLSSRAYKLKHDNSWSHKRQVDALARAEEEKRLREAPSSPVGSSQNEQTFAGPSTSYQVMTYTCPFASCSASFSDGGQLIVHMHTHGISLPIHEVNKQIQLNRKPPVKKKAPVKQFKSDQPIQSVKFSCRRCSRGFSKGISLSNHLRRCRVPISKPSVTHTEVCSVCQIPQRNKKCLAYHMKMYHPDALTVETPILEENYTQEPDGELMNNQCRICKKLFSSYVHMKRHFVSIHNNKPVSCKLCKQICKSKDHLITHYRKMHLKLKVGDHACYICFKICKSRAELYQHKKYNCSLKMKLFSCSSCGHSFKSEESLEKHKEEEHAVTVLKTEALEPLDFSFLDDRKSTACGICGKTYVHHYNLLRHVRNRHFNSQEDYLFRDANSSASVAPSTPTAASMTDDSCSSKTSSSRNTQFQGKDLERLFACLYCESKFTLRCNMLTHMKMTCRSAPPNAVCRGCKAERWPWVTGPCKECGKDLFPRKRSASTSLEPNAKKLRTGDTGITITPSVPSPSQPQISKAAVVPKHKPSGTPQVPIRLYKCSVGKRTFVSQKAMLSHSMSCDGSCKDQAIRCKSCNLVYPNPKAYLRHKPCAGRPVESKPQKTTGPSENAKSKVPTTLSICEFCPLRFKNRKSCCTHMRKVHKHYSKRGKRSHAEKILTMKTDESLETSEGTPPQPINLVNSNQASQSYLESMSTTETLCPACARPYPTHLALLQHIKNFHKNKICMAECTFCSRSILRRALYEHGFVCIKDQLVSISTLECVVCSTVFYSSDDEDTISLKLQEHIMNCCKLTIGRGERFRNKDKFLCLKCCMLFSSKKSLYSHSYERHGILIQTSPPQPKPREVPSQIKPEESIYIDSPDETLEETLDETVVGGAILPRPESVDAPVNNALIKCPRCSKKFVTKKGFKSHMRTHLFAPRRKKKVLKCQYCQRQFYNDLKLRNHEKVHGIVKELVLENDPEKPVSEPSSPTPTQKEVQQDATLTKQDVAHIIGIVPES